VLGEDGEQRRQENDRTAVDEREVETVANAEAIETRPRNRGKPFVRGATVHVEDAAALRVSERSHAVQRRAVRERRGRRPTATEDHERHQCGKRNERLGAGALRCADEPDALARQTGLLECWPQHLVDERRDRGQRCAARAEDDGVPTLEDLRGDVDRNVRPGLEVRADNTDQHAPLGDLEPVRKPPRPNLPLERRERSRRLQSRRRCFHALLIETQPIKGSRIQPGGALGDVRSIRLENDVAAFAQKLGGPSQRVVDESLVEARQSRARSARLGLDEAESCLVSCYIDRRFTLYCGIRGRACPLRIKRG
jgi:hypothetical protein